MITPNLAKALISTGGTRGEGEAENLTVPSEQERSEYVFTIGQHYYKPEILGVDGDGTIVFNSKGETKKVSAREYGHLTTLKMQQQGA